MPYYWSNSGFVNHILLHIAVRGRQSTISPCLRGVDHGNKGWLEDDSSSDRSVMICHSKRRPAQHKQKHNTNKGATKKQIKRWFKLMSSFCSVTCMCLYAHTRVNNKGATKNEINRWSKLTSSFFCSFMCTFPYFHTHIYGYVYIFTCTYFHIHIYIHIYACICVCPYAYTNTWMHNQIYSHLHMRVHTPMHLCAVPAPTPTEWARSHRRGMYCKTPSPGASYAENEAIWIHALDSLYIYTHVCVYTCVYVYTHWHVHTSLNTKEANFSNDELLLLVHKHTRFVSIMYTHRWPLVYTMFADSDWEIQRLLLAMRCAIKRHRSWWRRSGWKMRNEINHTSEFRALMAL